MAYRILDLETENYTSYKRKGNPFDPRNYIVMRGWKDEGDKRCSSSYFNSQEEVPEQHIPDHIDVIVAHNAKFELLFEKRFSPEALHEFFKRGGKVWCTQYAEYLLRGQQRKYHMCSLDGIVESYGGRKKIDGVKELWEAGMLTSEIDPALLTDYLIGTEAEGRNSGDIGNTELVYLGQLQEAKDNGMLPAIQARMDGLCATSEMEFNGLRVDLDVAREDLRSLNKEWAAVGEALREYITHIPEEVNFNWNSGTHVSCLLFGGTIKYQKQDTYTDPATGELARKKATEKWPLFDGEPANPELTTGPDQAGLHTLQGVTQDTYKSGKRVGEGKFRNVDVPGELKVKYQDFFYELPGYTKPDDEWKLKTFDGAGKPIYGTGSDIIDRIAKRDIPFLKVMGRYQALNKEIGTYYLRYDESKKTHVGMLTCVHKENHIVHHKLNHTSTVTTRLSSSDPNLQNVPRKDKSRVKAMFVSRFTEAYCAARGLPLPEEPGVQGELDYSQLEVVVQGLLTGDKNLIGDLVKKVDFHCKRVALKNSVSYDFALFHCKEEHAPDHDKWKVERTKCKIFSFQRAYGAGAGLIADETGMDLEEVKDMIRKEEAEYPGIPAYNAAVEQEVKETAEPFRDPERGWRVFRTGTYQAPTGCVYTFRSWDAPSFLKERGEVDTFSPTELKNYPVQGTGGEIVQLVLGILWRWFVKNDNFGGLALLTNTVHDCVWVDMHPSVVNVVIPGMKKIMEAVPHFLKLKFDIDCPVPFPVDAEIGADMYDLHHYEE